MLVIFLPYLVWNLATHPVILALVWRKPPVFGPRVLSLRNLRKRPWDMTQARFLYIFLQMLSEPPVTDPRALSLRNLRKRPWGKTQARTLHAFHQLLSKPPVLDPRALSLSNLRKWPWGEGHLVSPH